MAKTIIEAINSASTYQFEGDTAELRLYPTQTFLASTGQMVGQGSPWNTESWYLPVTCDVQPTGVLYVPSFEIDSTTDGQPRTSKYIAALFDEGGAYIGPFPLMNPNGFAIPPPELMPTPTWGQLQIYNRLPTLLYPPQTYPTRDEMYAAIAAALGEQGPKASETVVGITALSEDPTDPQFPIAVSVTDPIWEEFVDGGPNASITVKGLTKLDVAPASATDPIAVGVNSPRVAQKAIVATGVEVTDTAALQAAITSLGAAGGVIRTLSSLATPLKIDGTGITFPALTNTITFEVFGYWDLSGSDHTLTFPNGVNWVGLGGAANLQFQHAGPTAGIIPPTGNVTTLKLTGANNQLIQNLAIDSCSGIGIYMDGVSALGALKTLENVAVVASTAVTSQPIQIDAVFWVWMRDCSFLSTSTSLHSIRITTSSAAHSAAGLIYIDDTIIAGKGIKVDAQVNVSRQGNIFLTNVHAESLSDSLLTLDGTNGPIANIALNQVGVSDSVSLPYIFNVVAGPIKNIFVRDSDNLATEAGSTLWVNNTASINNLVIEGGRDFEYVTGWSLGTAQRNYVLTRDGQVDSSWLGQGAAMSPSLIPYTSLAVNQDASAWGGLTGTATVTTGIIAPDGTATAATLSSAGGERARRVYAVSGRSAAVGDWVMVGVWMRSEDATVPSYTGSVFATNSGSGPATFDSTLTTLGLSNDPSQRLSASWVPVVVAGKITTSPSATYDFIMDLKCDSTHPTSYWMPFIIHIPAATLTDAEVIRFKRYLTNVVSSVPTGSLAMYPHQSFYAGRVISQVITTFADADTTPSVAAGNEFTATNTAPTSITTFDDGVNGQTITILFTNGNSTIVNGASVKLLAAGNFVGSADDTLTLTRRGGTWYEIGRSVN